MVNRKKMRDNIFNNDASNELEELEEITEEVFNLHDKLLKMGFKEIAEDELKIHDKLLGIKNEKAKLGIGEQLNKLKENREGGDASTSTSLFLRDETGHIYGKVGVRKDILPNELSINEPARGELSKEDMQRDTESYRLFLQNVKGSIGLWLDKNLFPIFIDGAVNEITGYNKEEFHSMNIKWTELVVPEDLPLYLEHVKWVKLNPNTYAETEYRIRKKGGEVRWIREIIHVFPQNMKSQDTFQSFIFDINERKEAEERRIRFEETQKKEIHHRIKNNLQVISSLLDLQEENLAGKNVCNISKVREAFKESRDRIASMALIHEELYRSTDTNSLDFSDYIKKLVSYLFNSYKHRTDDISLKLNVEEVHLEMDIAIPLGSVATELISNAFKYAFPDGSKGEISIFIFNKENYKKYLENLGDIRKDSECRNIEDFEFIFIIKDNGIGLPKEIEFKNADTLGFQLVNTLIDQIDGCIELKNSKGAEFIIWFDHIKT